MFTTDANVRDKYPLVSFLCPTFGRAALQPEILDEAVYWFTAQTYLNCEMVILNDAPGQRLYTSVPRVRIVNARERFPSLGAKMSYLVNAANGYVALPAEDDDISLPWRAAQAVTNLWGTGYEYFRPRKWWYYEHHGDRLRPDGNGVGHNCSAYLRKSFLFGYPDCTKQGGAGHDGIANQYALDRLAVSPHHLDHDRRLNEISYVYRWGVSLLHLSAFTDMERKYAEADPGPDGDYEVRAVMRTDWDARVRGELVRLGCPRD